MYLSEEARLAGSRRAGSGEVKNRMIEPSPAAAQIAEGVVSFL